METIYEAFTSGKEVRRENSLLIKAMGPCDWFDEPSITIYAIDEHGLATFHNNAGAECYGQKQLAIIVHQPDPRDEVIKAAQAWAKILKKLNGGQMEGIGLMPEAKKLISAVANIESPHINPIDHEQSK